MTPKGTPPAPTPESQRRYYFNIQFTQNILQSAWATASLPRVCRSPLCCRRWSWSQQTPAARGIGPPPGTVVACRGSAGDSWRPYRSTEGWRKWGDRGLKSNRQTCLPHVHVWEPVYLFAVGRHVEEQAASLQNHQNQVRQQLLVSYLREVTVVNRPRLRVLVCEESPSHLNNCVEKNVQHHRDDLSALDDSGPISSLGQQLMEGAQSIDGVACGARKQNNAEIDNLSKYPGLPAVLQFVCSGAAQQKHQREVSFLSRLWSIRERSLFNYNRRFRRE